MDRQTSYREWLDLLASPAPTPGGGGACALCGALAIALGRMVANLTLGKKRYADVEEEVRILEERGARLQGQFLELIEADAQTFAPLAAAYRLRPTTPSAKEEKARALEEGLQRAASVPLQIMERCGDVLDILEILARKGSRLALSDVGVGATLVQTTLEGAALNVAINTQGLQNRQLARELDSRAAIYLEANRQRAQALYREICAQLQGKDN